MPFSLIKKAHRKTSLSPTTQDIYKEVAAILGESKAANVVSEAYRPTSEDFDTWLRLTVDYAQESGISLRKKADFMDIVGAVLENDPTPPPYSMHSNIMNKLWNDYKSQKYVSGIDKVAQAQEDEENAAKTIQDYMSRGQEDNDEWSDDDLSDEDWSDGETDGDWSDEDGDTDEDLSDESPDSNYMLDPSESGDTDENGEPLDREEWWDEAGGDEDMDFDETSDEDMDFDGEPDDGSGDMKFDMDSAEMPRGMNSPKRSRHIEDEERAKKPAQHTSFKKAHVAATSPKSALQQAITSPKENINKALKGVEQDGASAWQAFQLPQNPHPKGSMAYRSWERGLKNAMKKHLGVVPSSTPPKKKRK